MSEPTTPGTGDGQNQDPPPATPPQTPSGGQDAKALTDKVASLQADLTKAQEQAAALAKERDSLKSANESAVQKATTLEQQLAQAQQQVQKFTGDMTNLTTQLEQAQSEVNKRDETIAAQTSQIELYKVFEEDPKYAPLITSASKLANIIKPDASADDIKAVLDGWATGTQAQVDTTLQALQAGGSPPGGHGNTQQAAGPKNAEEAWNVLQGLDPVRNQAEYNQMMNTFQQLQQKETSTPN